MKTISISDSVVISLALRAEIRRHVEFYKIAVRLHSDCSFYLEQIRDLVHAYNSVNIVPFDVTDDVYLKSILK